MIIDIEHQLDNNINQFVSLFCIFFINLSNMLKGQFFLLSIFPYDDDGFNKKGVYSNDKDCICNEFALQTLLHPSYKDELLKSSLHKSPSNTS